MVVDRFSKVRDCIVEIAKRRPRRFRHKKGKGRINAAALGRALGVNRSTVRRILLQQRFESDGHGPHGDYSPRPTLVEGIGQLMGCQSEPQIWDVIWESPEHDDLDDLI